jgi:putative addiction module killer protein
MNMIEVRQYQTKDGKVPVFEWLGRLRDGIAVARITARLDRLAAGLRGDWRSVGAGVNELRIDHGPGYRVYFAQHADTVVILLCGGDKRTHQRT